MTVEFNGLFGNIVSKDLGNIVFESTASLGKGEEWNRDTAFTFHDSDNITEHKRHILQPSLKHDRRYLSFDLLRVKLNL